MKWERGRQSGNVEDRRGQRLGGAGGIGLGTIAIVLIASFVTGKNPLEILGLLTQGQGTTEPVPGEAAPPVNDEKSRFIAAILGSTEDVWTQVFTQNGSQYPAPRLVLFSGAVASACGRASSAAGPFYCPGDQQVYIDTSFFQEMQGRLGGGGDFAEAYVIAHEVGHHVQTLTGAAQRVDQVRQSGGSLEGDEGPLVRLELQADCFAGLWGRQAQQQYNWLEEGDIEEALSTATAIGDDRLQRQSQGVVVPDSFTHGTAEQRVRWFKVGFDSGDPKQCDTFAARSL